MRQLQSLSSFGNHIDPATFAVEHDMTINQRKQRVVFTLSDTFTGMPFISNLANKDAVSYTHLTLPTIYSV